jgi:hypothetical protein
LPGFDFLQGLVKQAGAAMPSAGQLASMNPIGSMGQMGQWVAPSLNPEEISKRIDELRTVQFWLEQNARMIDTAIKALEVQRMTLSTLQTMNVPLAQLRDALSLSPTKPAQPAQTGHPTALVDPALWWSNLTQQFTQLASQAVKDGAAGAAKNAAKQMAAAAVRQGVSTVKQVASRGAASPFLGTSARRPRSPARKTKAG